MIVDCHTHIWKSPEQLGQAAGSLGAGSLATGNRNDDLPDAAPEQHLAACEPVDIAIVLGFRSSFLQANVPNDFVAEHVRAHGEKFIGFAGIDPAEPIEAIDELVRSHDELGLKGMAVAPAAQDFHPSSTGAMRVFARAAELNMPVLFHHGRLVSPAAKMEFARPVLIDEIARELPDLKIIVAHMGFPWIDECVALLGKQPNVYADISGLLRSPWSAYNALLSAFEYGVMDRLLFGSGFPFASATASIEALYSINQITHGTGLPLVPREHLRAIVEHNALDLLGIDKLQMTRGQTGPGSVLDDDI